NGDGHFDAVCPASMPVGYKLFDTPGTHAVGLRVTDTTGRPSTSHTHITVGAAGGRRAAVRKAAIPGDTVHFWCGDRSTISLTNLGFLPHGFTSDVHAVGIDVTQGAVPTGPLSPGGSLRSSFLSSRTIASGNYLEDPAENRIAFLAKSGKTVARV